MRVRLVSVGVVSLAAGLPCGAATLLAQNRVVESNAVVFDGENTFTDPQMMQTLKPGEATLEVSSSAFGFSASSNCNVGQESSNITGDLIDHFTRVEASASATLPETASASGRSLLHVAFHVDEPEYWSLGVDFTIYAPGAPEAAAMTFILEREGVVLRAFETVLGLNYSDAMTLAPGDYTVTLEITGAAHAADEARGASDLGASSGLRFTRYATHCPGDVNGDRQVDFVDLNYVLAQYGFQSVPGGVPGDVNDDGAVNFVDLNIVLSNYSEACSTR